MKQNNINHNNINFSKQINIIKFVNTTKICYTHTANYYNRKHTRRQL